MKAVEFTAQEKEVPQRDHPEQVEVSLKYSVRTYQFVYEETIRPEECKNT